MRKTNAVRSALIRAADAIVAVTLAPRCASCSAPLDAPTAGCICRSCWMIAASTPVILWSSDVITAARAGGNFDGPLRDIIHAFKYDGRRSLAAPLAQLIRTAGTDVLDGADVVVPIPLHPVRLLRRGFNQASDLAKHLPLPALRALWRAQRTPSQSGSSGAQRRRNVRNAFIVSPLMSRTVREQRLRGRTVVLVDDVRTTGATLNACATTLLDAGVREVRALTAAARERAV